MPPDALADEVRRIGERCRSRCGRDLRRSAVRRYPPDPAVAPGARAVGRDAVHLPQPGSFHRSWAGAAGSRRDGGGCPPLRAAVSLRTAVGAGTGTAARLRAHDPRVASPCTRGSTTTGPFAPPSRRSPTAARPDGGPGCWSTTTPWWIGPPRCGRASAGTGRTPTCCSRAGDPGSSWVPSSLTPLWPSPVRRLRCRTGAGRATAA